MNRFFLMTTKTKKLHFINLDVFLVLRSNEPTCGNGAAVRTASFFRIRVNAVTGGVQTNSRRIDCMRAEKTDLEVRRPWSNKPWSSSMHGIITLKQYALLPSTVHRRSRSQQYQSWVNVRPTSLPRPPPCRHHHVPPRDEHRSHQRPQHWQYPRLKPESKQ